MGIRQNRHPVFQILGRSMQSLKLISKYKKEHDLPDIQGKRWESILAASIGIGKNEGLCDDYISMILHGIDEESVRTQSECSLNCISPF